MDPRDAFRPDELAAIRAATLAAEAESAGEVVPYIVGSCDDYLEAVWAVAVVGALAGVGLAALAWVLGGRWGQPGVVWLTLPPVLGAVLGVATVRRFPGLAPRLVPGHTLDMRVRQRAESAFLAEGVFATRDRTGILVFVALAERRATVLADVGIAAKVAAADWQAIVDCLTAGIAAGRPAAALVEAIEACRGRLAEHRVARRADDVDELSNEPRLHTR